MHPLTRFFNYLKTKDFSFAVEREHIGDRDLTEWYPQWMYELMETDDIRNQPYREAIDELVPGKVVLELGTGRKALWAVHSAHAGARKVYAIEANQRAFESSQAYLKANGVENVQIFHGFSDQVELPERCDVLVHDLIGDIGSSEGMIPFIEDAKRRFLKPDAVHIPCRCVTKVVLAEDPTLTLCERAFGRLMRGFVAFDKLTFVRFFGFPPGAALSEPHVFEDFVLSQPSALKNEATLNIEITRDGVLRGILFFLHLYLSESRVVDTWLSQTSWATPYIRFKAPTPVRKGDRVEVHLTSDLSGNPSYSLRVVHASREIGLYAWSGD